MDKLSPNSNVNPIKLNTVKLNTPPIKCNPIGKALKSDSQ